MKEENKSGREELKRLAKESTGALSWIKLSEPLEKRLKKRQKKKDFIIRDYKDI